MKSCPAVVVALVLVLATGVALGSDTTLRSVRVITQAGAAIVVVAADGPLPRPTAGVLETPPRIYLDFNGVVPATRGLPAVADPLVRGVRVALNRADPPVTRVVIDLTKAAHYRIEVDEEDLSLLSVIVGSPPAARGSAPSRPAEPAEVEPPPLAPTTLQAPAPAAPPATPPPASPPPASAPPAPARIAGSTPRTFDPAPAPSRAVPKDIERYLKQASGAIDRLDRLRPLLSWLDGQAAIAEELLQSGLGEFEGARLTLEAIAPSPSIRAAHQMLRASCVLGATSARTRLDTQRDQDASGARTAASAAAGALMLLDRARAELGLSPAPK